MSNGKGDSPRNCFSQQFRDNHDRIFGKKYTTEFYRKFGNPIQDFMKLEEEMIELAKVKAGEIVCVEGSSLVIKRPK